MELLPAIGIIQKSTATIQSNKIQNCGSNSISLHDAQHVEIQGNEILNTELNGISTSGTISCFIHNNKIIDCKFATIHSYDKSKTKVENNIIKNINKYAFNAILSSFIYANDNKIESVNECLANMYLKGGGDFVRNKIVNYPKQNNCETMYFYYSAENVNFPALTNDKSRISDNDILENLLTKETNCLCLKYRKNKRDCVFLTCGHKFYCKECSVKTVKSHEYCPICFFEIEKSLSGFGADENAICSICYVNKVDCIILPCCHGEICFNCMETWFNTKKSCPFCRRDVSYYAKIIDI